MSGSREGGARVGLALFVAVGAVSLAAPLVRLASPAEGLSVAALRIAMAALLLNLLAPRALREFLALSSRERRLILAAGVLLGLHFGVWIGSLSFTSVASSVTLVALQPLFAALIGRAVLSDEVSRQQVAGMAIAIVGTAVLAGGDLRFGGRALFGDALALAGALTAAAYLVVGRQMRNAMPLLPYLASVNVVAGCVLMPAALIFGVRLFDFSGEVYAYIAAGAIVPSCVGHCLLNWSVRRAPTHLVSLAILGEPIGAIALSWLLLAEAPSITAAIGGAIILIGIGVGLRRGRGD